jgi:hypothetical protein
VAIGAINDGEILQRSGSSIIGAAIGTVVQAYNAFLSALAALSTTGLIARTGSGTVATRTITAASNQVQVTDGNGVAGDPTLNIEPGFTSASYWNPQMWTDGASLLGTVAVSPGAGITYVPFGLGGFPVARITSTTTTANVIRTTNTIACLAQTATHRFWVVTGPTKTSVRWRVGLATAPIGNALKPTNGAVMIVFDTDSGQANAATNWYVLTYDGGGGSVDYYDTTVACNVDTAYEVEVKSLGTQVTLRVRAANGAWGVLYVATSNIPAPNTGMQPTIACESTQAATTRNLDFRKYSGWGAF